MANQGKHKKSPVLEWLEGEEGSAPTKSRGSHVVDSYLKKNRVAIKKSRAIVTTGVAEKVEPALLREPALPPKTDTKLSQIASWEHQRKLERQGNLRAPYQYRGR